MSPDAAELYDDGAVSPGDVVLLGLPSDENSSFLRGPAEAPTSIREALCCESTNLSSELGVDFGDEPRFRDLGDLALRGDAMEAIEGRVSELLDRGAAVLSLGGDHAVTAPIVRAYARKHHPLSLLQLDAHPDLYRDFQGNPDSHASTFARIHEERLVRRHVQLGIRTINRHQREQAERYGVEVVEMRRTVPGSALIFDGPVYLSLDLDVLDPAFAPGVSHPEPGGASVRDVIGWIHALRGRLVGADVVELNPRRDPAGLTALVAARFVKEIASRLLGVDPD